MFKFIYQKMQIHTYDVSYHIHACMHACVKVSKNDDVMDALGLE